MLTLLLIASLIFTSSAINTITNTFVSDVLHHSLRPYYSVGTLRSGGLVSVTANFPEPSKTAPFTFTIDLYDSSHGRVESHPGTFGSTLKIPLQVNNSVSVEGRVTVPDTYFILFTITTIYPDSLQTIEITIEVNGILVRKFVDVIRDSEAFRVFYLAKETQIGVTNTGGWIVFHPMDSGNRMILGTPSQIYGTYINPILPPGYYLLRFSYVTTGGTTETVAYQSDPLPCPHSPSYSDTNYIFAPC